MITTRSTKAEILAHARALEAQVSAPPTWTAIARRLEQVVTVCCKELFLLTVDVYNAGRKARAVSDSILAELRQPVLKP